MFNHLKTLTTATLLSMSLSANAIILELSYEGEISSLTGDGAGYSIGDFFTGSLLIDTDLAPTDNESATDTGYYSSALSPTHQSFVTGGGSAGDISFDRVVVEDEFMVATSFSRDRYTVNDFEINSTNDYLGNQTYSNSYTTIGLWSFSQDFIHGDGIEQSFSFDSSAVGLFMNASFSSTAFNEVNYVKTILNDGKAHGSLSSVSLSEYIVSVPEPSSLALLGLGLAGLGYTRRKENA